MRPSKLAALITLGALSALLCFPTIAAPVPSLDIGQYAHVAWTFRNGFLNGAVYAIAQTKDGYLWLGTQSGVFRFDGVRATPLPIPRGEQLPSTAVGTLLSARDGTLWIGTLDGLASWNNGRLTEYPALAHQTVIALTEGRDGTVWAGGFGSPTGKLCAIRGRDVRCYGDDGSLGAAVASLYEDTDGRLWVGAATGVWQWTPGPATRRLSIPISSLHAFTQGDHGASVTVAADSLYQIEGDQFVKYPLYGVPSPLEARSVLRDRHGGLWIGTQAHGLVHSYGGKTFLFTQADGLTADSVLGLFEDREGTIWAATSNGLDQFRESPVGSLSVNAGLSSNTTMSILAARDGSIWIGTADGLDRWKDGRMTVYRMRNAPGLPSDNIQSLFEDQAERIWVSGFTGLAVFENGMFTRIPAVPPGMVHAIASDNRGGLWLSMWLTPDDYGLVHLVDRKIMEHATWRKLGGGPGTGLVPDLDGGVWTGLLDGGIGYFRAGQIKNQPLNDQRGGPGRTLALERDRDGSLWAASENGLSRIKNGRVATLTTENGLPCNAVHWIIQDDHSSYWLYTRCGLLRIARTELDAWTSDPQRPVRPTIFDAADGIRSVATTKGFRPAVTKASDGRIWFLNGDTVSVVDPSRIVVNALPPPVHIEQITADRRTYDPTHGLHLPPRTRDLTIDYAALSFVSPDKIRFRYRLEGQDPDWREVVNHREVQYSNLAPGNYRFQVTASNNSGVWNEQGAALDFSIAPAYWQTNGFRAVCVAAFLLILWTLYQLRLRQVAQSFNARLEERVSERTRIARDLHDTLLQSFQGLLLRFQTVYELLPQRPSDAKETLAGAIDRTAQAITEGREAVQGLRASTVERNDLARAIRSIGEELAAQADGDRPAGLQVNVEGTSRTLHPIMRDEIYRIASEALRNAFLHAGAKQIEVELRYDERQLRLRVRDDGKGVDPHFLTAEGRTGHFGLRGMHERAKLIGGELTVWSAPASGTEIELRIPAARVYAEPTKSRRRWFGEKPAEKSAQSES